MTILLPTNPMTGTNGPVLRTSTIFLSTTSTIAQLTIPSTAQEGDYLLIAGHGGAITDSSPSPASTWWSHAAASSGAAFNVIGSTFSKLCEAADPGRSVHISTVPGVIYKMYVFTNPRRTDTSYSSGGERAFRTVANSKYYGARNVSTTTISSLTVGPTPIESGPGAVSGLPAYPYGPGTLKFTTWACYGTSNFPFMSYSGPGTFEWTYHNNYYVSLGVSYEINSTNLQDTGTVTVTNAGSIVAITHRYV